MGKKKPADVVIDLFGMRPLSRKLAERKMPITPGGICKWRETGLVPSRFHETLLNLARDMRLRLTPEMLICGV